jgi:hypothetical protein
VGPWRGWRALVSEDGRANKSTALLILSMAAVFAVLLALPGRTVTTAYLNDLFIFLDGAHRVVSGQVPNRDFHTALGPLVYYIPAAGLQLSGHLGAAMPLGIALFMVGVAPAMAHVLASRLRPAIALPFAAFLLLILAVPMNLGEGVTALTFGMFYNRLGWAVLATLLVMVLPPHKGGPRQFWLDPFCAALLAAAMLYLKVSFGVVGLAFLALLLATSERAWAALALAVTAAAALVVEMVWRSSAAHIADIILAGEVSGGVRGLEELVNAFLRHLADYVLFTLVAGLALWRTRSLRDFAFYAFCAGAGLLLIVQNSQPWGIISLHAGAVVAAERLMRSESSCPPRLRSALAVAAPLLVIALLLPTIVHCALALGLHAALATARAGQSFGLPGFDRIALPLLWSPEHRDFTMRYLASIEDGGRALGRLSPPPDHVLVLDFANPFSAGLGLTPPRGDSSWLHWGRNVNETHFIAPDRLFRDVRIVMEPKWGINVDPLRQLYGSHVAAHFDLVGETPYWKIHVARQRDEREEPGLAGGHPIATAGSPAIRPSVLGETGQP